MASRRWRTGLLGALPVLGLSGCGLVDAGAEPSSSRTRWVLVDTPSEFTVVRFDDPHHPNLQTHPALSRCCAWSPDDTTFLALGGASDDPLIGNAPDWRISQLLAPEPYDRAYFIDTTRFLAHLSPTPVTSEWVVRDIEGLSVVRFGQTASVLAQSGSGAVAILENEVLTLVRPDLGMTTLRMSTSAPERLQVGYDDAGEHLLIASWMEDAIEIDPTPDFAAHIKTLASMDCEAGEEPCHPRLVDVVFLSETESLVARLETASEAAFVSVPLEGTTVLGTEPDSEEILAAWHVENGDAWIDGAAGRIRRVVEGPDEGLWRVDEKSALDAASEWSRTAGGEGATVDRTHVDFDLLWLRSGDELGALDLSRGGEPNWLGPTAQWLPGPRRLTLLFEADSLVLPCTEPCRYAAYVDPSDARRPVLRGEMDAIGLSGFQWAFDYSGLLLLSQGWLYFHAFATPAERFPLARAPYDAVLR